MANQLYDDKGNELYDSKGNLLMDNSSEAVNPNKESAKPSTYNFEPGSRNSLLEAIHKVGYSGLSDEQKALYKRQYDASEYAKAGHSFEDAIKVADEQASNAPVESGITVDTKFRNPIEAAKNLYGGIRDAMSYPVAAALSLINPDEYVSDPVTGNAVKRYADDPGYWERVGRDQPELRAEAQRGEGLAGFAADPLNLTMFIPGLGETIIGEKLAGQIAGAASKAGFKAVTSDIAAKAGIGALEGAGYGALSSNLDPVYQENDPKYATILGAIGGGLGNAVGTGLKEHAIANFPGAEKLEKARFAGTKNVGMNELSRAERIKAYNDLPLIADRGDYFKLGEKYLNHSGEAFDKTDKVFDAALKEFGYPYGAVTTDEIRSAIMEKLLKESDAGGLISQSVTPADMEKYLNGKMAGIEHTASRTPRKIHPEGSKVIGESIADNNMKLALSEAADDERFRAAFEPLFNQRVAKIREQTERKIADVRAEKDKWFEDNFADLQKLPEAERNAAILSEIRNGNYQVQELQDILTLTESKIRKQTEKEVGKLIPRQSESTKSAYEISRMTPDEAEFSKSIVPLSSFGKILGTLNQDVGKIMSKNPTDEIKMALIARTALADELRDAPSFNMEGPIGRMSGVVQVPDASGNLRHAGYGEVLEGFLPGAQETYRLGKKLHTNIAKQTETGPSIRLGLPFIGEAGPHIYIGSKTNYGGPNIAYKTGKILSTPIGGSVVSRVPDVFGLGKDTTKTKKK